MACKKHGYTNNTFCPVCDLETIENHRTTQPPSHEEVQRLKIAALGCWHEQDGVQKEIADALESLLADNVSYKRAVHDLTFANDELRTDNVRLSGERDQWKHDAAALMEVNKRALASLDQYAELEAERDQLRARIGELEQAGRITGWHMEGNLRVFDCLTYTSGTTAYVKREDYDERIAALEKDAALNVAVNRAAETLPEGYLITVDVEHWSGHVHMADPEGNAIEFCTDGDIAFQVNEAIDTALNPHASGTAMGLEG